MTRIAGILLALLVSAALTAEAEAAGVRVISLGATESSTQAGAHPDVAVTLRFETRLSLGDETCFCRTLKTLSVNTPPGLVGTPTDLPRCTEADFAFNQCPVGSQVGIVVALLFNGDLYAYQPLYNMEPRDDQLALFSTFLPIANSPFNISIASRTESDYGLEFLNFGIPSPVDVDGLTQITWGVPASTEHDMLRFPFKGPKSSDFFCLEDPNPIPALLRGEQACGLTHPPVPSGADETPFISNPTACSGPLSFEAETIAFDLGVNHSSSSFPTTTGCDQLSFDPSLSGAPTTPETESPSGFNARLTVPQPLSPSSQTPSAIKATTVTLPVGMSVSSNAADGKTGCTAQQARFETRLPAQCPEFSKIGNLEIESSSVPGVLPGAIYLGEPLPGDRYRLYLVADGFSLHVKLAGSARLDPQTGQVIVTFDNLPQAPFQRFDLHLFGGERGLLVTPTQCGTYPIKAEFVPWAAALPNQTSTQFFVVDRGPDGAPCPPSPRPLVPSISAGVADSTGGAHSPFSFDLLRRDGDQNLSTVRVSTPPGFSASLADIPYCSEAAIANAARPDYLGVTEQTSPSCPPQSQVGSSKASAGAGSRPVTLPGRVYLTGPHAGAPLGLAVITPAVSGPYDLGNVVARVGLRVDPIDAHVTAISDPLPRILEGIPLRLRRIFITLDRPGFTLNPTNCSPFSIDSGIFGDEGAFSAQSTPFQVANCADLPYRPSLRLELSGGVNRRGHPAIRAVFDAKHGEANTRSVSVTLPSGELLDNKHIGTVCTRVAFAADSCPASSRIGYSTATSPLLDQPVQGPVFLRSSSNDLPDIAIDLEGQVDFELALQVDSVNARLRTVLPSAPDVPVRRFVLNLAGGRKGLLQNSESLCGEPRRAQVRMVGQNGVAVSTRTKLEVACGKGRHKRQSRARAGR